MSRRRATLNDIIFGNESYRGRLFDLILMVVIVASVLAVMLESIPTLGARHYTLLHSFEWAFTIIFTIEYVLRLYCAGRPKEYALGLYGVIDLMAILPTYISVFVPGAQTLVVVRLLRIMRVFRVLKLMKHSNAGRVLASAIRASEEKLTVFVVVVLILITTIGCLMYLIEGPEHGFTSIPQSMYWAIVTLTTVGYGDISPETPFGKMLAAVVMVIGYAIIAVPTGIIAGEAVRAKDGQPMFACKHCIHVRHDSDAVHCKQCGERLDVH